MNRYLVLLPVLVAFLVGAAPATAWTWPVGGPVLQHFQLGDDPYAAGQHRGIDVGAESGATVQAPAAGTVTFAGSVPRGGRTVTIETPDGYAVTLLHLGSTAVARGVSVREGDAVGTVGQSGEMEHGEPYVHLGVRLAADENGYLDPLAFLPQRVAATQADPGGAGPEPAPAESAPDPAVSAAGPAVDEPEPAGVQAPAQTAPAGPEAGPSGTAAAPVDLAAPAPPIPALLPTASSVEPSPAQPATAGETGGAVEPPVPIPPGTSEAPGALPPPSSSAADQQPGDGDGRPSVAAFAPSAGAVEPASGTSLDARAPSPDRSAGARAENGRPSRSPKPTGPELGAGHRSGDGGRIGGTAGAVPERAAAPERPRPAFEPGAALEPVPGGAPAAGLVAQLVVAAGLATLAVLALRRRTWLDAASVQAPSPAWVRTRGGPDSPVQTSPRAGRAVVRLDSSDELARAA